eukprot:2055753-Pyramimonas_sp.AAC.1
MLHITPKKRSSEEHRGCPAIIDVDGLPSASFAGCSPSNSARKLHDRTFQISSSVAGSPAALAFTLLSSNTQDSK